MAKRKWYVVTVGRSVGVFDTWLETAPLVKGVSEAIYQSFASEEEARRIFAQEMSKGTTRVVRSEGRVSGHTTPKNTVSEPNLAHGAVHGSYRSSPVPSSLQFRQPSTYSGDGNGYQCQHEPISDLFSPSERSDQGSPSRDSHQANSPISRSSSEPSSKFRRHQIIEALFKESDTVGVEARASLPATALTPTKSSTILSSPKQEGLQIPGIVVETPNWLNPYPKAQNFNSQPFEPLSPLSKGTLPFDTFAPVSLALSTNTSPVAKSSYSSIGESSIYMSPPSRQSARAIHHFEVDPRSPITSKSQVPELSFVSPLSFSRPSPSTPKHTQLPAHYESTGTPPSSLLFKSSPLNSPNHTIIINSPV